MIELLMEMVCTWPVVLVAVLVKRLVSRHAWKLKSLHQSVHSSDADLNAIITLKDIGYFVSTQPFVVIGIDLKDDPGNLLIFLGPIRRI